MAFYDLPKEERVDKVNSIYKDILAELSQKNKKETLKYFSDEDTYIRKSAYLSVGRIYKDYPELATTVIATLKDLLQEEDFRIRQTAVNAAGEIGKTNFDIVQYFFDTGLFDQHHSVRNAVIGSVKKMGEKNSAPVLNWAKQYLHHPDKEIRREICHGIELRGRTHPQDILPMLRELQFDKTARVRNTLVHVIGQISYKKNCLETVISDLEKWKNNEVVTKAIAEIIDVHHRYRNFSFYTQDQAKAYISKHFDI